MDPWTAIGVIMAVAARLRSRPDPSCDSEGSDGIHERGHPMARRPCPDPNQPAEHVMADLDARGLRPGGSSDHAVQAFGETRAAPQRPWA